MINRLYEIKKNISSLLDTCKVTVGTPCKPMLAKPTKSINVNKLKINSLVHLFYFFKLKIILDRFKDMKFTCEYKYDGLRG